MGRHTFKRFVTTDGQHYARCACGYATGYKENEQQVGDAEFQHGVDVERVKAHLGTNTPSLASQRDYYEAMAEDHRHSEHDRKLWRQLADEIAHRLGEAPEEEPLPGLDV